ncbi:MAG: diguanylate cyclase, partial [Cyanobacteria bacterium J06632_22]
LLLQAELPEESRLENAAGLWRAIATQIQNNTTVDSWVYNQDNGKFICTLTGLDMKAVSQYAETLQAAITEAPLSVENAPQAPITVKTDLSIGGVLADREHPIRNAQEMQSQAQDALTQAQQRGRNRIRILKAGKVG